MPWAGVCFGWCAAEESGLCLDLQINDTCMPAGFPCHEPVNVAGNVLTASADRFSSLRAKSLDMFEYQLGSRCGPYSRMSGSPSSMVSLFDPR
jgi:hypothetical protein